MYWLYGLLHKYDWGYSLVKFGCLATMFGLILLVRARVGASYSSRRLVRFEVLASTLILLVIVVTYGWTYRADLFRPPQVDIGYTTVHAASMLIKERKNPYSSDEINRRDDLLPSYRGFHYGPFMLVGYSPAAFAPGPGYKAASIVYLLVSALLLGFLVDPQASHLRRLAGVAFVLSAFLLARRFWYEVFAQGANDIFPVVLLLASLLALKSHRLFFSGFFLGLSFAAKFSPALFLVIALLRRPLNVTLAKGFVVGLIPLVAFVVWDPRGLFNNVFWLRLTIPYDSTSLYSVVPPAFHFVFPLSLLLAIAISLYRNIAAPLEYERVLVAFTLLLIVAEVTFKEMHANHLIWFFPLFALIFERHRYAFAPQSREMVRGPHGGAGAGASSQEPMGV
jgi:hypothetical protein